jgi:hypothetical protein
MSLNFSFDKIKDYESVCWIKDDSEPHGRRMNPVTNALIWGTISVGLGAITESNIDEFVARFRVIEKIHGAMLYKPNPDGPGTVDWFVSDEDFIAHIGLVCNVSNESRTAWARRIFVNAQTSATEEFARSFRRSNPKEEVA